MCQGILFSNKTGLLPKIKKMMTDLVCIEILEIPRSLLIIISSKVTVGLSYAKQTIINQRYFTLSMSQVELLSCIMCGWSVATLFEYLWNLAL